jgi:hypothetical protein
MTVLILDHPGSAQLPYAQWLRDSGEDLVCFTGRSQREMDGIDRDDYAEIRSFADYAESTAVERAALDLGRRTPLSGIVAAGHADLIRAGALRDHLGLPGQGRDSALVCADLVALRRRLSDRGIPAVPSGPVRRAVDLYWYAHRWGYPIRVRQRRAAGWPVVRVAHGEGELRSLISGMFKAGFESVPSLLIEPQVRGIRARTVVTGTAADSSWTMTGEHQSPLRDLLIKVMSAMPEPATGGYSITAICLDAGEWVIDSVAAQWPDGAARRQVVRAQAGIGLHARAAALR